MGEGQETEREARTEAPEREQEERPRLTMEPLDDRLRFTTLEPPLVGTEVIVGEMIAACDTHGLLLWAIFCQLRDTHHLLRAIGADLANTLKAIRDPRAAAAAQARVDELVRQFAGEFRKIGLNVPDDPAGLANMLAGMARRR